MEKLRGLLLADFASFDEACRKSETHLVDFAKGADRVGGRLNAMVDGFSGVKVIQDAQLMAEAVGRIGGVSKLTEQELARVTATANEAAAKLKAMGLDVPPGIAKIATETKTASTSLDTMKGIATSLAGAFGIAFSIGAVVNFGRSLIDAAGTLVDLNTKTGVSVEQLQRFQFVGSQSKVTVDQLADASFKLGVNLAGGKASVRQAAEDVGLAYAKLKSQSPDAQFNATIAALEAMIDPQERNRLGVELFGKAWATIAPAVAQGYSEMAKQAVVSSDAQVKALNAASAALDRFWSNQKAGLTTAAGETVIAAEEFGKLSVAQRVLLGLQTLLTSTTGGLAVAIGALNMSAEQRAKQIDVVLPKEKAQIESAVAYASELLKAQLGLAKLSEAEREGIKSALLLGESHDKIAVAFSLSDKTLALFIDQQQRAKTMATELEAASKKLVASQARDLEQLTKLQDLYNENRVKQSGTANEIEIAGIKRWAADLTAAFVKAHTDTSGFYDASSKAARDFEAERDRLSKQFISNVGLEVDVFRTKSIPALQELATNALKTFNEMVVSGKFFRAELDAQLALYHKLQDAARGYGTEAEIAHEKAAKAKKKETAVLYELNKALEASVKLTHGGSFEVSRDNLGQSLASFGLGNYAEAAAQLARLGYSFQEIVAALKGGGAPSGPPKGPRIGGFDQAGGSLAAGASSPALSFGNIGAPMAGGGGGGTITIVNYINGTAEEAARKIEEILMRKLKTQRLWPSA